MKTPNTITELNALQPTFVSELCSLNGALYVSNGLCAGAWQPVVGGAMGAVVHGAVDDVARPVGYVSVTWIGSVEPVNAVNNDIWEEVA